MNVTVIRVAAQEFAQHYYRELKPTTINCVRIENRRQMQARGNAPRENETIFFSPLSLPCDDSAH